MQSAKFQTLGVPFALLLLLVGCGGGGSESVAKVGSAAAELETPHVKQLAASEAPSSTIASLVKVSETRVNRTVYDYVFRVVVQNGTIARTALTATALSAGPGTTILGASVVVGDVDAGASVTPLATINLRHDRTYQFNPAALVWGFTDGINGIPVPPEPSVADNSSTIAGVDSNKNGVRDDLERAIAKKFGGNSVEYEIAKRHAYTLQAALVSSSELHKASHIRSFACASSDILHRLKGVTMLALNTPARRSKYGDVFAGVDVSIEGCE